MGNRTIKSCYIHIPFCKNICSYCDFCKNFYDHENILKYLNMLGKEIKKYYKGNLLDTVYIGGGTPSSLSISELNILFQHLSILKLSTNNEFTFECNYEDINEDLLNLLVDNKVNRISIGIETFNDRYANILNRNINKKEMIDKINLSKKYINNVNVDLMYALPDETIGDLINDIKTFIDLDVNHISTYSLIIEEHTKLFISKVKEVNEDIQSDMYYKIIQELKENGYKQYEISNFSKPGCESKHNMTYWNNDKYYGFGMGASGFINNIRYDNTKSMNNYLKGNYRSTEEKIELHQKIKDEVMLNLRKTDGINKKKFKIKYKISIRDAFNVDVLINERLLAEDKNHIYIPEDKLFISNEIIISLFDSYKLIN